MKAILIGVILFFIVALFTPVGNFIEKQSNSFWEKFFSSPHLVVIFTETTIKGIGKEYIEDISASYALYKEPNDAGAILTETSYIDPGITKLFDGADMAHSMLGIIPLEGAKGINLTIANINNVSAKNVELKIKGNNIGSIQQINAGMDENLSSVTCTNGEGCSILIPELKGKSVVHLFFVESNEHSHLTMDCGNKFMCEVDLIKRQAKIISPEKYIDIHFVEDNIVVSTPKWNVDDGFCYVLDSKSLQWKSAPGCYFDKANEIP